MAMAEIKKSWWEWLLDHVPGPIRVVKELVGRVYLQFTGKLSRWD